MSGLRVERDPTRRTPSWRRLKSLRNHSVITQWRAGVGLLAMTRAEKKQRAIEPLMAQTGKLACGARRAEREAALAKAHAAKAVAEREAANRALAEQAAPKRIAAERAVVVEENP